jgi:autotransporter strand-loop-strand O-heptosyltransferase
MPMDTPPLVGYPDVREVREPYVCIGVQASSMCKTWMGDGFRGWSNVVKWLKARGRRVLCIDKQPCVASGIFHMEVPNGAEDMTGDIPLEKRLSLLHHADSYIGGSSGLSWLAWCAGCPVVMISGFTEDWNEFHTPYRVRLRMSCSGCWNDVRHEFDHKSMMWCPRHMDDEARRFECTRLITSALVIDKIKQTPAFSGS